MGKKLSTCIFLKKNGELQNISYPYSVQVTVDGKKNLPSRTVSNINNVSKLLYIFIFKYFIHLRPTMPQVDMLTCQP